MLSHSYRWCKFYYIIVASCISICTGKFDIYTSTPEGLKYRPQTTSKRDRRASPTNLNIFAFEEREIGKRNR